MDLMAKLKTEKGKERAKKLAESLELEGSRLLEASKSGLIKGKLKK